ncbi:hypothetical protein BRC65_08945 [Halobacteriales archaeon QH_2_65_14]|nr:MAG: hypothetical protein BRC65_08945 [Halobacteriales archaeon QH_2_65_14]
MRYATVIMYPDAESFHPVEHELARDPDVRRKAIHAIKLLDDGTIALLAEVEGDLDRYREIMRDAPSVRSFTVSGDESGYCYSQVEATEMTRGMLERRNEGDFVIDMPVEYTDDGGQRVTIIGKEEALMSAPELLGQVDMELVSTGQYTPDSEGVFADLTDRQREVLETALRLGYYENPREATLEDVAAELDITRTTVGQHIRAVESKVFDKYVF